MQCLSTATLILDVVMGFALPRDTLANSTQAIILKDIVLHLAPLTHSHHHEET